MGFFPVFLSEAIFTGCLEAMKKSKGVLDHLACLKHKMGVIFCFFSQYLSEAHTWAGSLLILFAEVCLF